jgi:hypothetical protein
MLSARTALVLPALLLGALAVTPAHATGCRVDLDVNVQTAPAGVAVHGWYDPGLESGQIGHDDATVTVLGTSYDVLNGDTTTSGPGLVEQTTGIDVYDVICG